MQQKKLQGYRPQYPKKLIRGAALTAAVMLSIGGTACELNTDGVPPIPDDICIDETAPVETPGAPIPDVTPDPDPLLGGEPLPDEGEDAEAESHTRGEPALQGKILVPEDIEQP